MVPEACHCDRGDERLTNTIYTDIVHLAANFHLDLPGVARDLERIAKTGQLAPLSEAALILAVFSRS